MEHYHPLDFIAEDCNAGLGINRMGKGIRFDSRSFLATEVPTTFFGPGLNWWKQRQKSWEMGRHGRLFAFIRQLFFSMPAKMTLQGILWHKFTYFYLICTIAIDWLRIPTIVALGRTADWWRNALLLMLFSAIPALLYKYIKCRRRPDLQPRFWACLTYPFYKQIYVIVSIFGAIRCVGYYFGGHKRPLTVQQMLKKKDSRCLWLDPRFETNPAWLADEAEAQEPRQFEETHPTETSSTEISEEKPFKKATNTTDMALQPPHAIYQFTPISSNDFVSCFPGNPQPSRSPRLTPNASPSPSMSPWMSSTTLVVPETLDIQSRERNSALPLSSALTTEESWQKRQ
jgi:hypothetical protein